MGVLRPYQEEIIVGITKNIQKGHKKILVILGCGGGKSVIAGEIARKAALKENNTLFTVHRKEICQQVAKVFKAWGVDADYYDIGMVQTLARRGIKNQPKVLIVDECHHIMSGQYQKLLKMCPNSFLVGFTATPSRLDGKNIMDIFTAKVEGPSVDWLIQNKFLADYRIFNAPLVDVSGLKVKKNGFNIDYKYEDLSMLFKDPQIFGNAVNNWKRIAGGKKTIVYCHSVESSMQTVEAYLAEGISAAHLDGTTPKGERERVVDDFRQGKIMVLSNVDLFGEGFDVPDCECVQLLRPTASATVFVQQSMRPMRPNGSKVAIILDHTQNIAKFGTPRKLRIPEINKGMVSEISDIKTCPKCFGVVETADKECPYCGYVFAVEEKKNGEKVFAEADLQELDENKIPDFNGIITLEDCKTWDDLDKYRKQQGYKFGWMFYKAKSLKIKIPSKYYGYMGKRGII